MRLLVPQGNWTGPRRALNPAQAVQVRRLRHEGVSAAAVAELFGVSRRTVYRYAGDPRPTPVAVSGWSALFVVRPGRPPRQVSAWAPA